MEEFLENWKREWFIGEKKFEKSPISTSEKESLYLLTCKKNVKFHLAEKLISKQKFFQTFTVEGADNVKANQYVCQKILDKLEDEFLDDYNNFFDTEAKKYFQQKN